MNRRAALVLALLVVSSPLVVSCGDDDGDVVVGGDTTDASDPTDGPGPTDETGTTEYDSSGAPSDSSVAFDPCAVPDDIPLDDLVPGDVDLDERFLSVHDGEGHIEAQCFFGVDEGSELEITAYAFSDVETAAAQIRDGARSDATVTDLGDFDAPAFLIESPESAEVVVLGGEVPLAVRVSRYLDESLFEADADAAIAVAELLVDELEPTPGGVLIDDLSD